jgi:hypothetical protein
MHHDAFSLLCHPELGCDFYKLHWEAELIGGIGRQALDRLRQQIMAVGPARIVLAHCGFADALSFGQELGIRTYQGHYIDRLLAEAG